MSFNRYINFGLFTNILGGLTALCIVNLVQVAIGSCRRNASLIAINITQSLPRTVHDSDYEILVVVDLRALRLQSRHAKGLVTLAVL